MSAAPTGGPDAERPAYKPFRPVRARRVALGAAVLTVAALTFLAVILPREVSIWDRLGVVAFALIVAWFLLRHANVRAVPSPSGLLVRNLFHSRRLEWAEIIAVRLGGDSSWAQLDLSEGDTLPVMAIQRSDGAYAESEARRLATLVAIGSRTERND
ncbi:MAG: PH domain-containing protein [Actinomycetes bacterium]